MTKETEFTLPDFRNLGILLRAVLAAQVLGWPPPLVEDLTGLGACGCFAYAAYLEPPLLTCFSCSTWLAPKLQPCPRGWRWPACVGLAMLSRGLLAGLFLTRFGRARSDGLARALLLAGIAAVLILAWFDWRARRLSPALSEARLQALQARIRPHFLFNSINSVLSLMRSDPGRAEAALENLAELYRALMADNRNCPRSARNGSGARLS
jgi:two-component system sensor histidine kinase AlgZ